MPEGFCFAAVFAFFSRGHTLHISICVFSVLFSFVIFVVSLRVCLSACFFFVVCLFCAAIYIIISSIILVNVG
jgi:hypothetical protein